MCEYTICTTCIKNYYNNLSISSFEFAWYNYIKFCGAR